METIPERIAYFDDRSFDMYPINPVAGVLQQESEGSPEAVVLLQNYPNPFQQVTTIPFDLPMSGRVRLTIYSLPGVEQQVVIAGEYPAGRFYTTWDATGFPARLYFYRLKAGGYR